MSRRVIITIDGYKFTAQEGEKLLWVALEKGIYIPHLCAIKEQERPSASCRLCFVEVEGLPRPVTACTEPVRDEMVVKTRSPMVDRLVRTAFELLLSDHRLDCGKCAKNGSCELQRIARERGLKLGLDRLQPLPAKTHIDESSRTFIFDSGRCVLCGRCVWADQQIAGVGAIGFSRRGIQRRVTTFADRDLAESPCIECGLCVEACPVGALFFKQPAKTAKGVY
jgi:bidirectional [NiFe] hydrogenase diaphorase subunit